MTGLIIFCIWGWVAGALVVLDDPWNRKNPIASMVTFALMPIIDLVYAMVTLWRWTVGRWWQSPRVGFRYRLWRGRYDNLSDTEIRNIKAEMERNPDDKITQWMGTKMLERNDK